MTNAINARKWAASAIAENERLGREVAIKAELLNDLEGLDLALEGCMHFLNGGEGHQLDELANVRLSPSAAKFIGLA